mmetsp:Transcript_842/g.1276  ORF Transcript_842/g.1276 Transcript_842/m.1276 type:complete len:139 (-) Transcript_842:1136-1552(-)
MPHIDIKDFHWFMGVKFAIALVLFRTLQWYLALPLMLTILIALRHLIARILGYQVMGVGDFNTFVTNQKAPANIMTCTIVENPNPVYAREVFSRMTTAHVKARSCIVKVLGDMYYKELDADAVIKKQIVDLPDGHIKS